MLEEFRDPVCGVTVNAMNSNGWREYRGRIYYFCSVEHRDLFDKDPERYAFQDEEKVPQGISQ